jgi:hypothetical protein
VRLSKIAHFLNIHGRAFETTPVGPAHDCQAGVKKGTVKDVQGRLRHSRAATTADVYMQEIPESVQAMISAIHAELRKKPESMQAG